MTTIPRSTQSRSRPHRPVARTDFVAAAALALAALCGWPALAAENDVEAGSVAPLTYGAGPPSWSGDLSAIPPSEWTYERAAHLLERAGFGGRPEAIARLAAMGPKKAVDELVDYEVIDNRHLTPFVESGIWDPEAIPDVNDSLDFRGGMARANRRGEVYGVKPNPGGVRPFQPIIDMLYYRNYATRHEWERASIWWAERMLNTRRPLEEKMTLFWHGHFAVEQEKVRDYRLMLDQFEFLRNHAVGSFRDLLLGIAQDPGMMVYLDNRKNVKGHANENFAREIMELFALGVGNYTEDDVKEAARAFTGWGNYGPEFLINPDLHDEGMKSLLAETGNFDGEDVIDILLRQKACAEFISGKLYRFFVQEDVPQGLKDRLAGLLRDNEYELKPLLKTIFLSRDFYSPAAYGTRIKGPVHFMVSSCVKLGLDRIPGTPNFNYVTNLLGQALGNPPNVAGWDGGRSWVNPSTLIERGNVMRHLLFPGEAEGLYDLGPFAGRYQRYVNAHVEVLKRDRATSAGIGPSMGEEPEMMEDSASRMSAPSSEMINKPPGYDLPYGVYNGKSRAFARVRPPDQSPAQFSLSNQLQSAGIKMSWDAVTYLERRFLRLPLRDEVRKTLTAFAEEHLGNGSIDFGSRTLERDLRELLHSIMSTPEYQLS